MMRQDHISPKQRQRAKSYYRVLAGFPSLITDLNPLARCRNPISEKNGLPQSYSRNFATLVTPIGRQNPFSSRKNVSPQDGHLAFNGCEGHRGAGCAVTTTHLFRPNQPRKAVLSLRFWLRNPDLAPQQTQGRETPRGGSEEPNPPKGLNPRAQTENFSP
jgi:hypothetical protein